MTPITIDLWKLILVFPIYTVVYLIVYNRVWIWNYKRSLYHILLTILTIGSIAGTIIHKVQVQGAEKQRTFDKIREIRRTQAKIARENAPQLVTLLECQDSKQIHLPGEWRNLYQSLKKSSYWEAKLTGIESFATHYGIEDVEPLPMVGFNLILSQVVLPKNKNGTQSLNQIRRAKKALEPYLSPFNAQPTCVMDEEPKKEQVAKKSKPEGEKSG